MQAAIKFMKRGPGEIVQSVKCMQYKHKDLWSESQNPHKKPGMPVYNCNASLEAGQRQVNP